MKTSLHYTSYIDLEPQAWALYSTLEVSFESLILQALIIFNSIIYYTVYIDSLQYCIFLGLCK